MANAGKPDRVRGELDASRAALRHRREPVQQLHHRAACSPARSMRSSKAAPRTDQIEIVRVPGSFEIPIAAKKFAATGRFDSLICIGCVLRGETSHYDYVASETARGIQLAQLDTGVPMIFCVLTCDTLEQAIDRAGLKSGNKGYEVGSRGGRNGQPLTQAFENPAAPRRPSRSRRRLA